MRVILSLLIPTAQADVTDQKTATIEIPDEIGENQIRPGINLILNCNQLPLRVPIKDVDIDSRNGATILRIDPSFQNYQQLLAAPEFEWFATN